MKVKSAKTVLIVGMAVAAVVFGVIIFPSSDPVWNGHPAGYWFEQSLVSTNYAKARQAFVEMGVTSVPFLIEKLAEEDSWRRKEYKRGWSVLPKPIQSRLAIPRSIHEQKIRAAMLLGAIGPGAAPALPALITTAQHPPPDAPSIPPILVSLSTNRVPIVLLNSSQMVYQVGTAYRTNAVRIFGIQRSGDVFPSSSSSSNVIPSNPPVSFSSQAQITLRPSSPPSAPRYTVRPSSPSTAPRYSVRAAASVNRSGSVSFDSVGVSISAIQAIGEIGVADSAIYAPLLDQVNSSSYRIQTASVDAINAIVHRDHSRIGQFIVALRDWRQIPIEDRYYSREVIDQLIGSLVATVPELTPGLVECLQTGGLRQRRLAAQGFGSSPAPDDNIINALSASLECPDDQVQSAAMDSLLRLEAKTHRATTALALAAAHSMPEVRGSFARGLARIGPRGIAWTRVLEALAMDPDPAVRREAALALWLVDNQNAPLVQVRIEDLKAPSEFKRLEAVMSLARLGSEAAKAMGPLIEISKTDPSVKVRKEAVRAISRIEQKDGAIPASASAK